jgi:hypothetical protein
MIKTNFLRNVATITACLAVTMMASCGGGSSNKSATQTSDSEKTTETKTEQAKISDVPTTPAEFLSKFGLSEADVKPSDAGEGTLEVAPNDPNHGQVVYKSANLKDGATREKFINTVLDKTRSLATDGKLYTNISTKEEFQFKQGSFGVVFQYNYGSGYVTFNLLCMDGKLTVGLWK